jgi:tetratricopeptide (TPR) repeat protein
VVEIAAGLVALGWALCLPAQSFSIILMPTAWLVCAYWWCVWICMQPAEQRPLYAWAGFGVLIGVVAMMVATILFAIVLFLARIGLSVGAGRPPGKRALRALSAAALLMLGVFAGASPAWIHNYFVVDDPVFLSAHSGLNFWMGNSPGANGYPKIPAGLRPSQEGLLRDSITWAEKAAGHPLKRSEVSKYWSAKANDYIARYPEAWHALMLRKLRNFWNRFEYDDISVITLLRERGVLWPGPDFGVAAGFGLVGAALALLRRNPAGWVVAAVALHMLAIMPVFVTERYRLAAVPGLLVLGVYALFVLWQMFRSRQTMWYGLAIIAGLALSRRIVTLPTDDPALRSLDIYNVGVKELAMAELLTSPGATPEQRATGQGELQRADAHLTRAYQMVPSDPGVVFAMGNLAFDKGDSAAAKAYYEKTLALNPHFAGALNNLGYLATEEKRWPDAERLLTEAVKEDAENARSHYLLALAREALGQAEAARVSAAEAVRLAPREAKFRELLDRLSGK